MISTARSRSRRRKGVRAPDRREASEETDARRRSAPEPTAGLPARVRLLVRAIQENDERQIEERIVRLSRSRRVFAPLGFVVGAFVMLFDGLRLLVSNWRLTLVQIPPAVWIWLAMFDLKLHVLRGKSFNVVRAPVLIPIALVIVGVTVTCFFLNAVFAFAISRPGRPQVRPAIAEARRHLTPIVVWGVVVGLLLAFSTTVVTRWGRPWFTISLGIVVGVMMVSYVAVPSRLIGVKQTQQRRDRISTSVVTGLLSATVCTPPYVLGRIGILMLGSTVLLLPGIFVLALGVMLQAGATGAVRAIKLSATLTNPSGPSPHRRREKTAKQEVERPQPH